MTPCLLWLALAALLQVSLGSVDAHVDQVYPVAHNRYNLRDRYDMVDYSDTSNTWAEDSVQRLREDLAYQVRLNPSLYDPADVEMLLRGPDSMVIRYLNQRNFNHIATLKLMLSNLAWRKSIDLRHLTARDFPCDLFAKGLIFEQTLPSQDPDKRIVWIRLGALGNLVKHLESHGPKGLVSFVHHTVKPQAINLIKSRRHRHDLTPREHLRNNNNYAHQYPQDQYLSHRRPHLRRRGPDGQRESRLRDRSLSKNDAIQLILKAIAWWLNSLDVHSPQAKVMLIMDFEDTDHTFSSYSIADFLVQLNDRFPDLFESIVGFRYKLSFWSIHGPVSLLNRIFASKIKSSRQTDLKVKFSQDKTELQKAISNLNLKGVSYLPAHVVGNCDKPVYYPSPAGCSRPSMVFEPEDMYLWSQVSQSLEICSPRFNRV